MSTCFFLMICLNISTDQGCDLRRFKMIFGTQRGRLTRRNGRFEEHWFIDVHGTNESGLDQEDADETEKDSLFFG